MHRRKLITPGNKLTNVILRDEELMDIDTKQLDNTFRRIEAFRKTMKKYRYDIEQHEQSEGYELVIREVDNKTLILDYVLNRNYANRNIELLSEIIEEKRKRNNSPKAKPQRNMNNNDADVIPIIPSLIPSNVFHFDRDIRIPDTPGPHDKESRKRFDL